MFKALVLDNANGFTATLQHIDEARLPAGDVTVADLVEAGAVRAGHPVKVLGTGEISVAVNLSADAVSASAKTKIEAAGGSVTVR